MKREKRPLSFLSCYTTTQFNTLVFAVIVILLLIFFKRSRAPLSSYKDLRLRTKEEVDQALMYLSDRLSEAELVELNNLILKGMSMLSPEEREKLIKLQKTFSYKGYKKLNDKDIITMRKLNYKGISLLPEEEQARFNYLMLKGTGKIQRDIQ